MIYFFRCPAHFDRCPHSPADRGHPLMNDPGALTSRNMGRFRQPTGEQELLRSQSRLLDPRRDSGPRGLRQLKLDWPLGLSLHDHRPRQDLVAVHDVANAQFAVYGKVEHGQMAYQVLVLKVNSDGPDVPGTERWLLADRLSFVPRFPSFSGFHVRLLGDG